MYITTLDELVLICSNNVLVVYKLCNGRDVEGSGHALVEAAVPAYAWHGQGKP
jgi:hypothetical protein